MTEILPCPATVMLLILNVIGISSEFTFVKQTSNKSINTIPLAPINHVSKNIMFKIPVISAVTRIMIKALRDLYYYTDNKKSY